MGSGYPIDAEAKGLKELFRENYHIPIYQRPYEWEEKNIDDFLTSITDGYKEMKEEGLDSKPVFFGAIQVNKEEDNIDKLDIVDGQQRLTTFILLIDVLQDNCKRYCVSTEIIDNADELRASLCKSMDEGNPIPKTSKYYINKGLLSKKLEVLYKEAKNDCFYSELLDFILDNVYVVRLLTERMDLSDVVSVFKTINTTGLDLNASDVFKFLYYGFLKNNAEKKDDNHDVERHWMEEIDKCYSFIERNNVECNREDQAELNMSWVLDIYKHIICAQFGWGFSEVSKSNQKFFEDLFKKGKYKEQKDWQVLQFDSFKRIVEGFVTFWRWIENARYHNDHRKIATELFSINLVEKTRYSRYWTIPFVVAYFISNGEDWSGCYEEALRINLAMSKFFTVYTVINDRVINAVQNKVCLDCFKWFKTESPEEIEHQIKNLIWSPVRWNNDTPKEKFYETIREGLFYNGSRAHLICTISALIDEIDELRNHTGDTSEDSNLSERNIQNILFNWGKNPFDIEHILARNIFKDDNEFAKEFNGIGNLVVLDRGINRDIKDIPVEEKKEAYVQSKYTSVKKKLIKSINQNTVWDIGAVRKRQQEEVEKLQQYMGE